MSKALKRSHLMVLAMLLCLAACSQPNDRVATKINEDAALTGLPSNPLRWKVIASTVNKNDSTMSTLFGNDAAVAYARSNSQHDYPGGSVLALVTWKEQEDARWFGGNIPAIPRIVEFVSVGAGTDARSSYGYENYEGTPLKKISNPDSRMAAERSAYIVSLRAAVMP